MLGSQSSRKTVGNKSNTSSGSAFGIPRLLYTAILTILFLSILILVMMHKLSSTPSNLTSLSSQTIPARSQNKLTIKAKPQSDESAHSIELPHKVIEESVSSPQSSQFEYDSIGCLINAPEYDYGPHIVSPPAGPMDLVCCNTTVGMISIAVHKQWAPVGADNFLNMVTSGFFSSKVVGNN